MQKNRRLWWAGGLVMALVTVLALLLPTGGTADQHENPGIETTSNHFKCYAILDWTVFEPRKVQLKDQFGESVARVLEPRTLCNPVDKSGEGIADAKTHLVCYQIQDDPQANTPRVKEVAIKNQFQEGPLWVGGSDMICLPSDKTYQPRG